MANYESIDEMLNTTVGMEHLVNNVGYDDNTLTFPGVDWFYFNNVLASTLYVSGNTWIGLGSNAEQLLVCRRDAKLWNFYREEGTLYHYYKFLKIRWEGYAQYNSTAENVKLVYEWFLFDTGDMFLNLIQPPSNGSYLGTNRVVCGSQINNFTVVAGESLQVIFTSQNEQGTDFLMEYGQIIIEPPYDRKFLISDANGIFYTVVYDEELKEETLVEIEVEELVSDVFREYGVDDMPQGDLLISLLNPVLHFWQDSENEIPSFGASLTALPPSQVVFSKNTLMNDSTILGIEKVDIEADDQTLFAFSFDGGDTWQAYINDMWVTLSEARSGMSRETVESIGTDAWNQAATDKQYMIRFVLFEGGYVTKITIHYLN